MPGEMYENDNKNVQVAKKKEKQKKLIRMEHCEQKKHYEIEMGEASETHTRASLFALIQLKLCKMFALGYVRNEHKI